MQMFYLNERNAAYSITTIWSYQTVFLSSTLYIKMPLNMFSSCRCMQNWVNFIKSRFGTRIVVCGLWSHVGAGIRTDSRVSAKRVSYITKDNLQTV